MSSNFKVIIVGGGPVGLSAAHALRLAGIDFVVLEKRPSVFEDEGAGIGVLAHTMRTLHQFGILDKILAIGLEIGEMRAFDESGRRIAMTTELELLRAKYALHPNPGPLLADNDHGAALIAFHRAEFLEILYDGLPHQARDKVLTGKKVTEITSDDKGVSVSCSDGTAYKGSIIIGADGVHSQTRQAMRDLALGEDPAREWDPVNPFVAEYNLTWFTLPPMHNKPILCNTRGTDRSLFYMAGKNKDWGFACERLAPDAPPDARYTKEDVDRQIAKLGDLPLMETHKLRDATPQLAGMTDIHEGTAKNWSHGRIVLVGDACHKMAPHIAQGYQNGLQDVVALCNRLCRAVRSSRDGDPGLETLSQEFAAYKEERLEPLTANAARSAAVVRTHAERTWLLSFLSRHVYSWDFLARYMMGKYGSPMIAASPVLEYAPASEPFTGLFKWLHPMPEISDMGTP